MRVPLGAAFFFLAFAAAAAPLGARPSGEALLSSHGCKSCHRVGPSGGDSGPDLSFVGFRRSREWLELWLAGPRHWKKDARMPDFRLSPFERAALGEHLSSLRGFPAGERPWEGLEGLRKGRVLYARAGCVACHGPAGRGGQPNNNVPGEAIPALEKAFETFTREELVEKIRRGSVPVARDPGAPSPLVAMPPWGEVLDSGEIGAVADYLLSLRPGTPQEAW